MVVRGVPVFAKFLMTATFAVLLAKFLLDQKFVLVAIFGLIYAAGFWIRFKDVFWKASFLFSSLMAIMLMFAVFGGLEPNTPGAIDTGEWFTFEIALFFLFVFCSLMALVAGLIVASASSSRQEPRIPG
jgi:hypothetical protein